MGVAQEEVPHRVDTNYVGKPATEADKLLGEADEAFNNEILIPLLSIIKRLPKLAI